MKLLVLQQIIFFWPVHGCIPHFGDPKESLRKWENEQIILFHLIISLFIIKELT